MKKSRNQTNLFLSEITLYSLHIYKIKIIFFSLCRSSRNFLRFSQSTALRNKKILGNKTINITLESVLYGHEDWIYSIKFCI